MKHLDNCVHILRGRSLAVLATSVILSLAMADPSLGETGAKSERPSPRSAKARQEMRIATVDMKRVFAGYHKTEDAERVVNEGKAAAKRDLDDRNAKYKSLISRWQEKQKAINDPQINEILRLELQKSANGIAAEAKALEREMAEFRSRRERQLQAQVMRMRRGILDEIQAAMIDAARRDNIDLLFDSSGESMSGTPFLLYSKDLVDLSEELLKHLNQGNEQE